ncbi:hypothetical protein DO628_05425 [Salmonella enterica subsp. salamae]|uniref:Uncharacterized protein n=6 Tax=Salmonella enterica TaxID=28901 RepID=A0A344QY99_SALER|nr:hypothetical protein DOE60_15275 [Salmonella enterica subsp. salamae serovar 56:z10:e,n,x]AXC84735.1 hypothetical protein DOE57_05160 [Salmonella enterica subsp. salamae serovar 56:b:[1,5]]EAA4081391.1 hypothetical protein [Salmonella enterica subsp. salamae serovar Sofia]EAA4437083.1 hypothetical protein [Salmonella enterica subsp. salamae]EAA8844326.1 hypothetical protein [Salmonella enterica subsp. enterica]EAA9517141.1 hypothetical protein [Salmonella enterica]ECT8652622.1 hypothetical
MLLLSPLPLSSVWVLSLIHFTLQAASVLTAFNHPSHILMYAPEVRAQPTAWAKAILCIDPLCLLEHNDA